MDGTVWIFWRGWGILALLIWVACLGVISFGVDAAAASGYYKANVWPKLLASVIPAPIIWFTGRAMNGSPRTKSRRKYGARHTLFWVPMEYWGPIFLVVGVIVAVVYEFKKP